MIWYFDDKILCQCTKLPVKKFCFEKYPFLEREFQNIFIIYFLYTYEPYLLYNQPNKFHEGTYDVRIQIQFLFTQYILVLISKY